MSRASTALIRSCVRDRALTGEKVVGSIGSLDVDGAIYLVHELYRTKDRRLSTNDWDEIGSELLNRIDHISPQTIGIASHLFSSCMMKTPMKRSLMQKISSRLTSGDSEHVELISKETTREDSSVCLSRSANSGQSASRFIDSIPDQGLSNLCNSYSKLDKIVPDNQKVGRELLLYLTPDVISRSSGMSDQQVANILNAYSRLWVRPDETKSEKEIDEIDCKQRSSVSHTTPSKNTVLTLYLKLAKRMSAIIDGTMTPSTNNNIDNHIPLFQSKYVPTHLSITRAVTQSMNALCKAGLGMCQHQEVHDLWFKAIYWSSSLPREELTISWSAQDISVFIHAIARNTRIVKPHSLLGNMATTCIQRMHEFDKQNICNIIGAFADMGVFDGKHNSTNTEDYPCTSRSDITETAFDSSVIYVELFSAADLALRRMVSQFEWKDKLFSLRAYSMAGIPNHRLVNALITKTACEPTKHSRLVKEFSPYPSQLCVLVGALSHIYELFADLDKKERFAIFERFISRQLSRGCNLNHTPTLGNKRDTTEITISSSYSFVNDVTSRAREASADISESVKSAGASIQLFFREVVQEVIVKSDLRHFLGLQEISIILISLVRLEHSPEADKEISHFLDLILTRMFCWFRKSEKIPFGTIDLAYICTSMNALSKLNIKSECVEHALRAVRFKELGYRCIDPKHAGFLFNALAKMDMGLGLSTDLLRTLIRRVFGLHENLYNIILDQNESHKTGSICFHTFSLLCHSFMCHFGVPMMDVFRSPLLAVEIVDGNSRTKKWEHYIRFDFSDISTGELEARQIVSGLIASFQESAIQSNNHQINVTSLWNFLEVLPMRALQIIDGVSVPSPTKGAFTLHAEVLRTVYEIMTEDLICVEVPVSGVGRLDILIDNRKQNSFI